MFYEEIRIKQGLSYISFCPLRILYNSKFIIMATSLGTNAVVIMGVHCTISDMSIGTKSNKQFPYMETFSCWYHFAWQLFFENCNA